MSPSFANGALVQYQDEIGVAKGAEPVRKDDLGEGQQVQVGLH